MYCYIPFDLHASSTPSAFNLNQDQILTKINLRIWLFRLAKMLILTLSISSMLIFLIAIYDLKTITLLDHFSHKLYLDDLFCNRSISLAHHLSFTVNLAYNPLVGVFFLLTQTGTVLRRKPKTYRTARFSATPFRKKIRANLINAFKSICRGENFLFGR
jgi:hypothetical protein